MRCSIVVIIDRSGSMKDYNYMEPAKTDASSFIASMHPGPTEGDSLGVVAFNQDSAVIFGSKTSLAPLKSKPDQLAAIAQVKKLKGTGQTNMAGAIVTAGAMLKGATGNLAEVLLSDGQYNKGLNPRDVLVGAPPIYTISLGPSAGTAALEEIAKVTGGQYHDSPDAYTLQQMYNYIAGEAGVAALLTNVGLEAESFFAKETPTATVPAGAAEAMFVISWTDSDTKFTLGRRRANRSTSRSSAPGRSRSRRRIPSPATVSSSSRSPTRSRVTTPQMSGTPDPARSRLPPRCSTT